MQRCLPLLLLLGCFPLFSGCSVESKQEFTVNPDGSGKVKVEAFFVPAALGSSFEELESPYLQNPKDTARRVLEKAQGVEAWRDVSFGEMEDGRFVFHGTAYFNDLSRVRLKELSWNGFDLVKDASGQFVLTPGGSMSEQNRNAEAKKETRETVAERIKRERAKFRQIKPLLSATIGTIRQEAVFHFAGEVRSAVNFQTINSSTVKFVFDGARLVQASEELLFEGHESVTGLNSALAAGSVSVADDERLNEKLYGQRGAVKAIITRGKTPLFDYKAEVGTAREQFHNLAAQLGLDPVAPLAPAVQGAPVTVAVRSVQLNQPTEPESRSSLVRPDPPYTLKLQARLPGAVLRVSALRMQSANTTEGVSLLPKEEPSPRLHFQPFPRLSDNRGEVNFDVNLNTPPLDAQGLREISGVIECVAADSARTVDLGFSELKPLAGGKEFGASIESLRPAEGSGEYLNLKLNLKPGQILSLKAVSVAGEKVVLRQQGYSLIGSQYAYTFHSDGPLPRTGNLLVEVEDKTHLVKFPFAVSNLTLLGRPLNAK